MMFSPADLAAMFAPPLGEAVTLAGVAVQALVDMDYVVMGGAEVGLSSKQVALTLPTASVPAVPVGKAAAVRATNYVVVESRPDGAGVSVLLLERA